jgi:diguanylate cyclase (GGDEF)-like protein
VVVSAKPLHDGDGRVVGWRGVASDVSAAQLANRQLTWLAHYDPLTGVANRHHFRHQLAEMLAPAQGTPRSFALLCLDLDHFKTINDTLGHGIGDALLQEVARRLGGRARRSDTVARLGGDEFAILLRDVATRDEAEAMTRRLLEGLLAPCEVQGARIAVRTSIGIAMAPADGTDIDALLNCADLALYAAKSAGRGEFRFYAQEMATSTRRRLLIEQELRGALGRGELRLHYQPQVDLAAWRVTGFEALLRWQHAELGEVSPAEFVPVAEEAGLVPAIGEWVLRRACRDAAQWPAELGISVNVSPAQAMSNDLLQRALGAAEAAGLAPQRLELEITESLFLDESGATLAVLHGLREAGVRIALDDFGTGYSSLAYLRRFPFDTLKIDRSFVRELLLRRDARAIVRMIVGLGRTLKMQVLAEGVEQPEQANVLREYGCQTLQGFLVARPMAPEQIPAFLAAWPLAAQPRGEALATDLMPM